jgi:hypothetical protein
MRWKYAVVMFLAMVITSVVGFLVLERLNVNVYLRGGTVYFAMAMVAWMVARDYVRKNMLFGRSFASWFFGTLAIAVVINILIWRFWPR